ncbi:MAG TPA: low affinity iron permease family protein [Chthoniobacteraceae bacterium]|jgi:low affinity Fe/Cu permease|nr:low affinity iron permease family protein [Chthoniobacteraceae bacterium]
MNSNAAPTARDHFNNFARKVSVIMGSVWAFLFALGTVAIWGATGPLFGFSDTWQLVINTGTTVVTFIMVFLIQSTQNRDAKAVHLKLDELIRAVHGARNQLVDLENVADEELEELAAQFSAMHKQVCSETEKRQARTEPPRTHPQSVQ